jgi:UDP-glucose 4-epimerase
MSSTLITGAPGWLGNTLLERLLHSQRSIRLLVDPVFAKSDVRKVLPPMEPNQFEMFSCDLQDQKRLVNALSGVNSVFHLAAAQHPKRVSDIYSINTEATGSLARLAADAGVEKFVFVSSGTVQGANATEEPTNELSPPGKLYTHYAFSKLKAEALVQKVKEETGLHVVIVRPGVFYGSLPSPNMQRFMKMIQTSRVPVFGKEGFRRTYADVRKVAEALVLAEANGKSGHAYIAADVEPLSTREVYETLAKGLGCQPRIVNLPVAVSRIAEKSAFHLGQILDRHLRMANIMGEFGRPNVFVSVLAETIGFQPLNTSRPGLMEMAGAYLAGL